MRRMLEVLTMMEETTTIELVDDSTWAVVGT